MKKDFLSWFGILIGKPGSLEYETQNWKNVQLIKKIYGEGHGVGRVVSIIGLGPGITRSIPASTFKLLQRGIQHC